LFLSSVIFYPSFEKKIAKSANDADAVDLILSPFYIKKILHLPGDRSTHLEPVVWTRKSLYCSGKPPGTGSHKEGILPNKRGTE
jgi:hypothetical protein